MGPEGNGTKLNTTKVDGRRREGIERTVRLPPAEVAAMTKNTRRRVTNGGVVARQNRKKANPAGASPALPGEFLSSSRERR